MLTAVMLAAALFGALPDSGQAVAVIARSPAPAETRTDANQTETRRVCRFETVTGSNRRTRVCRDVPRQGVQDQVTREFMRDNQRVRVPDE
ncbi:MAG: hypothetical protein EON96_20565 [Caulobacteraceae bacterium]|nr:MAG: hypothetical protein EON96_20565 [Caulobacteraceae bacterium]